jgi:hypothetical protein
MSQVTANQVRKVQKYSAVARGVCTVVIAALVASLLLVIKLIVTGPHSDGSAFTIGPRVFPGSEIDGVGVKAWLLVMVAFGASLAGIIVYLLRRIFANMARGEIFNAHNIRHVRQLGGALVAIGVLNIVIPVADAVLGARGLLGAANANGKFSVDLMDTLAPFAVAGIIYLASWIMLVGLGVSEEAAELRRDADLVV